ncbi:MAG: signal peptidase I [Oscillospiraceae bacterium]|nr:signal peptidase I [Oscillospiraceae bacterium]
MRKNAKNIVSVKGKRVKATPNYGKVMLKLALAAFALLLILLNLFTVVFSVVRYYGDGMEPTLESGQILLIRKTASVEEGDIIAFYYNNKALVRRVICEGGKTLVVDDGGGVLIDGEAVEEEYVLQPSFGQSNVTYPYTVPTGQYFVMGDNRAIAMDSRLQEIGTITSDRIIGKVVFGF